MSAKIQATGWIGRNAQQHAQGNGEVVYRFPMATHTMERGPYGYYRRTTEWHWCEVRSYANNVPLLGLLAKGTKLAVSGRLCYHKWETDTLFGPRTAKQAYIAVDGFEAFGHGGGG